MKKVVAALLILVVVLAGCTGSNGKKNLADVKNLTIAIAPTNNPEIVQAAAKLWTEELTKNFKALGYDLTLNITIATDSSAIVEGVNSGQIDLGFVPASNYVIAREKYKDTVSVLMQGARYDRQKDGSVDQEKLSSSYDSTLYINTQVYNEKKMDQWTNAEFAKWVADGSAKVAVSSYTSPASYVWPVNFLLDNKQDPKGVNFVKVDNNFTAIQQVADGNADAAFSYFGVNQEVKDSQNANYQNINETTKIAIQNVGKVRIPNDVAIVNGKYTPESQEAIFQAFAKMVETESGVAALNKAYNWIGVARVGDDNADWKVIAEYLNAAKPYNK